MGNICCTSNRRRAKADPLPSFPVTIWNSNSYGYCELRFNFMYLSDDEQTMVVLEFLRVSESIKVEYIMNHNKRQGIVLMPCEQIESIKSLYKARGLPCSYTDLRTPTSSPR
jgi:hypothetical protein